MRRAVCLAAFLALVLISCAPGSAGPPFLTDDPEPVPYHHFEFYTFSTTDKTPAGTTVEAPAFEFNYGPLHNVQLHIVVPYAYVRPLGGLIAAGIGDTELGVKFRRTLDNLRRRRFRPQPGRRNEELSVRRLARATRFRRAPHARR